MSVRTSLTAALGAALTEIRVEEGGTAAHIGDRRVEADSVRELRIALGNALYEEWHAGIARRDGASRAPRRDRAYEDRLVSATPHTHTRAKAVVRGEPTGGESGLVLAEIDRVRVQLPVADLRPEADLTVGSTVEVDLPAVRPALSPGFLLLDGPHGHSPDRQDVLRVYVHVEDADAAPLLWNTVLEQLASRSVRYRAKVISRPWSFPRRDAIVVYLGAADAAEAPLLAEAVRTVPGLGRSTSRFAHELAPGVAVAWDPRDSRTGWDRMSFGQHRAAALADGVMRHAAEGGDLEQTVVRALAEASIDAAAPASNLSSPPLPDTAAALPAAA